MKTATVTTLCRPGTKYRMTEINLSVVSYTYGASQRRNESICPTQKHKHSQELLREDRYTHRLPGPPDQLDTSSDFMPTVQESTK